MTAAVPDSMLAYRILGWQRPPELVEVPVPVPGPGEALIEVAGCGLCHSDLTMISMPGEIGEALGWTVPFTLGHETAGWVVARGGHSDGVSPAVGDAVAVISTASCGACRWCAAGREALCPDGLVGRGYGRDGGLAQFVVAPVRDLVPLGSFDPVLGGPLTDAGATSHHAVRRVARHLVDAPDGGAALVIGAGGLGAFVIQLLRATTDATVVVVERDRGRREVAAELGAHVVIDGVDRSTPRQVRDATDGGVDAVVDLVGSDDTIAAGLRSLAGGGAYAIVGAGGGALPTPAFSALPRETEIFTFQGSDRSDLQSVAALAAQGRLRVDIERFELGEVARAYERLHDGELRGRAVVTPPR